MRYAALLVLALALLTCSGCRKHTLSDFTFTPTLTQDQLEDQVGSPTRISASTYWWSYALKDGTELRVFFLTGPRGSTRTLTGARLYSANGTFIRQVYELPTATPAAATAPTAPPTIAPAAPATQPTTRPTASLEPTTSPA